MNKIKQVKAIGNIIGFNIDASGNETYNVQFPDMTIAELESYQFEEVDAYHTNGKPLCLRNVLARLRELPEHDRNIWLKGIMGEFKKDFSHAKWCEGYEQGKFEGAVEAEKSNTVVIPQFVADCIIARKGVGDTLIQAIEFYDELNNIKEYDWINDNSDLFARAWLDGYDVEQEKLYTVEIPDPNADSYSIALGRKEGKVYIRQFISPTWQTSYSNQLTEAEIKQDFDWAWQWAKPAEVQEVEE
ncbi:DUF1642 domain-containing protein [Streptococcus constellatus]|uniref:DUF1642 domain-containing protein n=1 Tax=Streptococcus constellatus TaxID=76860 RepID=UPI00210616BE|nr:DUF1642 domain-containing protein [Streptococcus constellatus]UTX63939.1 hypothetical protein DEH83_00690 [Streptococcus constellatus]